MEKKTINERQLMNIVENSVKAVLKEWSEHTMPGLSKNPKVRAAQEGAEIERPGKNGKNSSVWGNTQKYDGNFMQHNNKDLSALLRRMEGGDEEAGIQFAHIYAHNEEIRKKVEHALSDIAYGHMRDYFKWNKAAEE